jgi:hypothetical protein
MTTTTLFIVRETITMQLGWSLDGLLPTAKLERLKDNYSDPELGLETLFLALEDRFDIELPRAQMVHMDLQEVAAEIDKIRQGG